MKTIHLHGKLRQLFGPTFKVAANSPRDAIRAMISQLDGFREALRDGYYRVHMGAMDQGYDLEVQQLYVSFGKRDHMHLIPTVQGADDGQRGIFKIALGVILIGAAFAFSGPGGLGATAFVVGGATGTAVTFGNIAGLGLALALSGTASLITSLSTAGAYGNQESPAQRPSFLFTGPVNVSSQGNPLPCIFGRIRVGSVVGSTGITTELISVDTNPQMA